MARYAGLDVSDRTTHLCVVDEAGEVIWRGVAPTDPEALAKVLAKRCPEVERVVLETGALSSFLHHGLTVRGVPVICICARHAKGVLSTRINKSDPHDAEGLAQLARTGWFKAVHVKGRDTHLDRARLRVRDQLVKARRSMLNQLRGLLKLFGLRLGDAAAPGRRQSRLDALFGREPALRPVLEPLVAGLAAIEAELATSNRALKARASADPVCRRLMTAPGVGPVVALAYRSAIEDPGRFEHSADVGAYAGLVPRRFQSGERDFKGRITKAGDAPLRHALYEAANALLGRVKRDCPLRAWGLALAAAKGARRARVAVARKLAALLHTLWRTETDFRWA